MRWQGGVGAGVIAVQRHADIPDQAEDVDDPEGAPPDPVAQVKGDRDQQDDVKRDHAHAHPEWAVRGDERHQDLCERIGHVQVEHQHDHMQHCECH